MMRKKYQINSLYKLVISNLIRKNPIPSNQNPSLRIEISSLENQQMRSNIAESTL